MSAVLSDLLQLPARKRLEIAERLWFSVADEARMPVPTEHKQLLRKRLAGYKTGKIKAIAHTELMRRVRSS
jgi:putative addiction module component (TIGR02574 family)